VRSKIVLPWSQEFDVRTNFVLATICGGYSKQQTTTAHRLRIYIPQDFHALHIEDKENLSREQPGPRYSIVKEGNAPFG
jgi:Flp pilus assembly CpaF family ATPase